MQYLVVTAVAVALVSADIMPLEPVAGGLEKLLLTLCGVATLALFARTAAIATCLGLRRDFARCDQYLRWFNQLRRVHLVLWIGMVSVVVFGLQWATLVRGNWQLADAFLVDDLLIVAPVLLPLILSWFAFYDVDNAVHMGMSRRAGTACEPLGRRRYVGLHIRHYLGVTFVPLLLVLIVHDAYLWLAPEMLNDDVIWAVLFAPVIGLVVVFPWLLRYIWHTEPLAASRLRDRLERINQISRLRPREILVWHSGGMVTNAAVAGILPAMRYVFLSDGLLTRLSDDQIVAVYAHELAHIRYRHLLLRFLALILPLPVWYGFVNCLPGLESGVAGLAAQPTVGGFDVGVLTLMLLGVYFLTVFAWYSRQLEFQADLSACRTLADESQQDIEDAAGRLIAALSSLTPPRQRGARGLLHPALDQRVRLVKQATTDRRIFSSFQKRMRWLATLLLSIVLIGTIACLL